MMADSLLQAELLETKADVQRLGQSMSVEAPTLHKNLSLITLVLKWSVSDSSVALEEFLSSLEAAARIGRWQHIDKREIAVLNFTDSATLCYQGCTELHEEGTTWQSFKSAFRRRYEDVHTDQYHFTKLQTVREGKKEPPQEFEDRCKGLAQKIVCKADDPLAQRIHREKGERMLIASFVSALTDLPGRHVRYASPQTLK